MSYDNEFERTTVNLHYDQLRELEELVESSYRTEGVPDLDSRAEALRFLLDVGLSQISDHEEPHTEVVEDDLSEMYLGESEGAKKLGLSGRIHRRGELWSVKRHEHGLAPFGSEDSETDEETRI